MSARRPNLLGVSTESTPCVMEMLWPRSILRILSLEGQNRNYAMVELCDGLTWVQSEMAQQLGR